MNNKPKTAAPPPKLTAEAESRIKALAALRGVTGAEFVTGINREAIARICGGLPLRRGTIAMANAFAEREVAK
jgi:hypothetical protein